MRQRMRAMDLRDLRTKRLAVGHMAYKARLLRLIKIPEAKQVAGATSMKVSKSGGGASGK